MTDNFDPLEILLVGNEKLKAAYDAGIDEGRRQQRIKFHKEKNEIIEKLLTL